MALWDSVKDFFRRLLGLRPPPPPLPPPVEEVYYRNSKVRMYYAKEKKRTGTPTPFAEFRVFMITKVPMDWRYLNKVFDRTLDNMEFIFRSFTFARGMDSIYFEELGASDIATIRYKKNDEYLYMTITGREENVIIEKDEAEETLLTTGLIRKLPSGKWVIEAEYGIPYRYFALFTETGDIDEDYNEFDIRYIERQRIREYNEWKAEKEEKGEWLDWLEWQKKSKGEK